MRNIYPTQNEDAIYVDIFIVQTILNKSAVKAVKNNTLETTEDYIEEDKKLEKKCEYCHRLSNNDVLGINLCESCYDNQMPDK